MAGGVWALPWNMNVGLLYYRRDLLDKYGLRAAGDVGRARRPGRAHPRRRAESAARRLPLAGQAVRGPDGERARGALGRRHRAPRRRRARSFPIRRAPRPRSRSCASLIARGVSPPWITAADEELTRRAFGRARDLPAQLAVRHGSPHAAGGLARARQGRHRAPAAPSRRRARRGLDGRVAPRRPPGHAASGARGRARRASSTSEPAQRVMVRAPRSIRRGWRSTTSPTSCARSRRSPRSRALTLAARPRPVTPYYLMLSTMLQPELSAALVGVKTPARAVADARRRARVRPARRARGRSGRAAVTPRERADRRAGPADLAPALDGAGRA